MRRYFNENENRYYNEGQSLTRQTDKGLFSGVPTEEQLKEWGYTLWEPTVTVVDERMRRMGEIQQELASMDYLTSKFVDGEDMSAYGDWQGKRRELRAEYNRIEEEIEAEGKSAEANPDYGETQQ